MINDKCKGQNQWNRAKKIYTKNRFDYLKRQKRLISP
jgi:hypothetical protein